MAAMSTLNRTWRWNMAGPVLPRRYSTLNDMGLATLWFRSAIWSRGGDFFFFSSGDVQQQGTRTESINEATHDASNAKSVHRSGVAKMNISDVRLTERNAWMRSALTEASGLPLTRMVYVSSRSLPIRVPNQERFVSSGDDSGVRLTSSPNGARHWKNEQVNQYSSDLIKASHSITGRTGALCKRH